MKDYPIEHTTCLARKSYYLLKLKLSLKNIDNIFYIHHIFKPVRDEITER